jgi:Mat/Ecp fimbriae major subunit
MFQSFHKWPLAAATVLAFAATGASAAPASQSGTGRANVLQQITATNTADLDFGTIVAGTSASTVGVAYNSIRTCGAGLTCSGTVSAPAWLVTTSPLRQLYWNGTPTVTVTSGAGDTMTVDLLNLNSVHNMPASGSETIRIGAILNIGANQPDGNYSGTFAVDFSYP